MMPLIPTWTLILFALLSAHVVRRRHGFGVAIPRFYIAFLYFVIHFELLGDPTTNIADYVAVTRYGVFLIFLADTIPAAYLWLIQWWKHRGKQT